MWTKKIPILVAILIFIFFEHRIVFLGVFFIKCIKKALHTTHQRPVFCLSTNCKCFIQTFIDDTIFITNFRFGSKR